jgi:hypothetical protein
MVKGRGVCTLKKADGTSGGDDALKYDVIVNPMMQGKKPGVTSLLNTMEMAYRLLSEVTAEPSPQKTDAIPQQIPQTPHSKIPQQLHQLSPDTTDKLRVSMDDTRMQQVADAVTKITELERILKNSPLVEKLVGPYFHGMYREHDEADNVFAERVAQQMIHDLDEQ